MPNIKRMRNAFDLSHTRLASMHLGDLVPVMCEDIIPGDTFKVTTDVFCRAMPMVSPVLHPVNIGVHYWFVPYRIIWDNWEAFITGYNTKVSRDQAENVPTQVPVILQSRYGNTVGSLACALQVPVTGVNETRPRWSVNALPFRAYAKIWNEWYRNEYLQDPVTVYTGNGTLINGEMVDGNTNVSLLGKNWEKDYFTSALPFTQRGADSTIPISGNVPVIASSPMLPIRLESASGAFDSIQNVTTADSGSSVTTLQGKTDSSINPQDLFFSNYNDGTKTSVAGLMANLEDGSTITVNELRLSVQIQRWAERMARYGSRYVEILLSIFGIKSSDQRLQRPEFLGGATVPLTFSEVLQTSQTDTTPQGTLAGHGIAGRSVPAFNKTFEEHGVILAIAFVIPRTMYINGLPRYLNKRSKFDFYWPQFAHLGQQAIDQREIYAADGTVGKIFGYQDRYDEYRRRESSVSGQFRTTMDYWHLGRKFDASPTLSDIFLNSSHTNTTGGADERVFADPTDDTMLFSFNHKITAVRPLPITGEPGLMDHF